ncbi:MAG: hypothetical protein HKN67_09335 [Saprospiraceae bacterium]|nr:hypothetical protein [Saprospiraceae bacterium]
MKILLVIAQYKPATDPNIQRWSKILQWFQKNGDDVFILTTQRYPEKENSAIDNIPVYRAGHQTLRDAFHNISRIQNKRNITGKTSNNTSLISKSINKLLNLTWRKKYWPDGSVLFLEPGIKKGDEIIKSEQIEQLVSVGVPFTCHVIAQRLKELYPDIKWHMDIQDPFSFSDEFRVNNHEKFKYRNTRAEYEALQWADTVSVNNKRTKTLYNQYFPFIEEKISVIPPLFSVPEKQDSSMPGMLKDKIHVAYFGSFYETVRSPEPFILFLEKLKSSYPLDYAKLQLHYLGQHSSFSREIFNNYSQVTSDIHDHGFLPRPAMFELLNKMDVLLHIGNTTDYHLPSKSVEYLFFNKPVVNFTQRPDDSFDHFVNNRCPVINIRLDKSIEDESLRTFLDFVTHKREKSEPSHNNVQKYTVQTIAGSYKTLFTQGLTSG